MLDKIKAFFEKYDEWIALIAWYNLSFTPVFLTMETNWRFFAIPLTILMLIFSAFVKNIKLYLVFLFLGMMYSIIYACLNNELLLALLVIIPTSLYWFLSKHGFKKQLEETQKK